MATNPSAFASGVSQAGLAAAGMPYGATLAQLGWLAESYPALDAAATSGVITSGVVYMTRITLGGPVSVTSVLYGVSGAGATLTAAQNFVGLYDASGNQIGTSADQSAVWTSTGFKTTALAGGPFAVNQPFVYVAWLANGTTPPGFTRASGSIVGASLVNGSATGSNIPFPTNSSALTTLPGSLSYAANSGSASSPQSLWAALA